MIGVFDSGIGGLTLLHELRKIVSDEDFIYYADTDNVPYSYRTPQEIRGFVENAILFLREKGCKIVVLACNTATNVSIAYLREKYTFPIVAIQPAVKVAADNNAQQKRILSCATPVTLNSQRYLALLKHLKITDLVDNVPLPELVRFAEQGIFEGEAVIDYLKKSFENLDLSDYQYFVMGCTHFTYFAELIKQHFPTLVPIDGNNGTARRVQYILETETFASPNSQPNMTFYESGRLVQNPAKFLNLMSRLAT